MLEELAELQGPIRVTRPLVEAGWADYTPDRAERQNHSPQAPDHGGRLRCSAVCRWRKRAELIIAINSDPNAPIFNIAHYGLVGDLYPIVEGSFTI